MSAQQPPTGEQLLSYLGIEPTWGADVYPDDRPSVAQVEATIADSVARQIDPDDPYGRGDEMIKAIRALGQYADEVGAGVGRPREVIDFWLLVGDLTQRASGVRPQDITPLGEGMNRYGQ